jgi:HSP20 family molecular chaperone IbpA
MGSNRDQSGLSGLGDIIKGVGKLLGGITDIADKDSFSRHVSGEMFKSKAPAGLDGKYDFSIKLGLDKEDAAESPSKNRNASPQADIRRDSGRISIILELPGADKDSLRFHIQKDMLFIDASGKTVSYHKEIGLEGFNACEDEISVTENNGIYTILLKAADGDCDGK